jgi:hypothetical protein
MNKLFAALIAAVFAAGTAFAADDNKKDQNKAEAKAAAKKDAAPAAKKDAAPAAKKDAAPAANKGTNKPAAPQQETKAEAKK